jgi:hypothetical protein
MAPATLNEADKALVERVRACHSAAETEHRQFREKAARYYGLYRNYTDFRDDNRDRRDRDVMKKAKREWGAELFIPYAFRTVETIVPRMLAHRPQMVVLPEDEQAFGSVENMRLLLDKQQERINYELVLQDICKDGLVYGLGVQKVCWKKEYAEWRGITQGTYGAWVEDVQRKLIYDDAVAEWVDPFNFLWDPFGHDVPSCDYVIHRTFRNNAYVARMVERQVWRSGEWDASSDWNLEDLLSSAGTLKYDELEVDRRSAEGLSQQREQGLNRRHEVWEFHDRWNNQVITVLNGEFPVQIGPAPMPDGRLPFQVFRPTRVPGRMAGIGEIEPIEDLQDELNTLRGMRLDAANVAINRGYAYDETAVDADDLMIGPNVAIPVNGNPRDFLFPLPISTVDGAGYQEGAEIKADIETTSGISDSVTGGEGTGPASTTATGVQLVQQAAGLRIQGKTMRMGREIIIPGADQFRILNQVKILTARPLRVAAAATGIDEPVWRIVRLGPAELQGDMATQMDDGSTMAKNTPQMRQDAQMLMTLVGNPLINQQWLATQILKNFDVEHPAAALAPQEPQLPASTVEGFLQQIGVPNEALVAFLDQQQAAQQDPNAPASQGAPGGQLPQPQGNPS